MDFKTGSPQIFDVNWIWVKFPDPDSIEFHDDFILLSVCVSSVLVLARPRPRQRGSRAQTPLQTK